MRIARPKRPEVAFKRKRGPAPQATKLLTYSMVAGIVFIILLAVVFVPRGLVPQPPREIVNPENDGKFRFQDTSDGTRLFVDSSTASLGLSEFNATFWVNNTVFGHLERGLAMGANTTLNFTDANTNGVLDSGDYFTVRPPQIGCYRFEVHQVNVGSLAGYQRWGACST